MKPRIQRLEKPRSPSHPLYSPGIINRDGLAWFSGHFWSDAKPIVLGVRGIECAARLLAGSSVPVAPQPDPEFWPYSASRE